MPRYQGPNPWLLLLRSISALVFFALVAVLALFLGVINMPVRVAGPFNLWPPDPAFATGIALIFALLSAVTARLAGLHRTPAGLAVAGLVLAATGLSGLVSALFNYDWNVRITPESAQDRYWPTSSIMRVLAFIGLSPLLACGLVALYFSFARVRKP